MGDAIGNEVLAIQSLLRDMGVISEIYAENIDPRLGKQVKKYQDYKENKNDIILHHFGIGSNLNDYVLTLKNKIKIIRYHNITPHTFFEGYSPVTAQLCRRGREQLARGNKSYKYCLAVSEYNKEELLQMEYSNVEVIPILLALQDYENEPEMKVIKKYQEDGMTNLIFVGRVSPNKKQEDVIKIFYYYKKYFNSNSRLFIVGSYNGMERYYNELLCLVGKLGVKDVVFTGHISFKEILAYYHIADMFLCMSEHEGFCVPLVESMFFKVPIIAYDSSAIANTLGGSGILAHRKDFIYIAGMVNYVLGKDVIKQEIIKKQYMRLDTLRPDKVSNQIKEYLNKIIGVRR